MKVLLTGSSSCLAAALLPELCADPRVQRVIGIDVKKSQFLHSKFESHVMDTRSPSLSTLMAGSSAVIHLAYAVIRGKLTDDALYENNVSGTLCVMNAAKCLDIQKFINISSVSVYGDGKMLEETDKLKPSNIFTYAQHKAEIESKSQTLYPNVIHLRSHLIFGKHAQPFLQEMVNSRICIKPSLPMPVLQIVHELDVAKAIIQCFDRDVCGAFNLAAPEVMSIPDLVNHGRRRIIPVPLNMVKKLVSVAKLFGSRDEYNWLEVMDTSLTVSCKKAATQLNWRPTYTAWDALTEMQKSLKSAA
jgi:UDP-glucose 4-epimerase